MESTLDDHSSTLIFLPPLLEIGSHAAFAGLEFIMYSPQIEK